MRLKTLKFRDRCLCSMHGENAEENRCITHFYFPKSFCSLVRCEIATHGGEYDMIYLLTAIGLSPGGRSTVHIYTQTIHRTIPNKQYIVQHNNLEECGPCPVLASYTLAFALQPRKKHGKTSVRIAASKNT